MMEFIIWLVACFISTIGVTYMYYRLNGVKLTYNLKLFLIFTSGVVFITILKFLNVGVLSSLAYFIFYPILFYVVKPCKVNKLIYYVFVIWLCGILLDFSSMLIMSLLYYLFKLNVSNSIYIILMSLYVFSLYLLFANIKKFINFLNDFYKLISKIKYSDFLIIIFTIFVLALAITLSFNMHHINIGLLIATIVLLVIFIFALLLRSKYNELENSIFINTLRKNNAFYLTVDKEQNIFKHNLIAKLLSVESVANKKARMLLQDLIKEFNSNIDYSQKIKDIPYGLDGVINEKIYPYNDKIDIKIDNKIDIDIFDVLKPRRYNVLVEKLSILLDNALESCVKSYDKILVINLYEENNQICIEIKNTFVGIMNVDEIGKVNYSTKGNRRGFGLYSVFRNNEVSLNVKVVNNMFVARLSASRNINLD
ncbi:MAG: GHKL domain-containing protein [Firmicutes bacterium]|nr:GHKL domain-containing protein [Bacillota bacterium]